jgi:uncharacterized tellurite resistance protein B-like protein
MIDLVKQFFSTSKNDPDIQHKEDVTHDIRIATCAILLEMANIDGEFSEPERKDIIEHLQKVYELSDEYMTELIKNSEKELEGSIDLWKFTNLINQNYSLEEKIKIIEMVWEIAYSDGRLDQHEDYLAHKLANLLRLNHKQLIDAKLKVIGK